MGSRSRRSAVAEAGDLVLRQGAVAADVAVLATDDEVGLVLGAVVEDDRDPAAVAEVELLLLLVQVAAGLVGGRDDDPVDSEGSDAERLADLAEAVALAHV